MRRFRVPLGRVWGIRLWIHATWFPAFIAAVWILTTTFGEADPSLPLAERVAMGIVTSVAFFSSLACHELAHARVAMRYGIGVRGITLFLFGGVAQIDGEVPTPRREVAVAIAGPATSVVIAAVSGLAALVSDHVGAAGATGVLIALATANAGVAIFNLVPGLPLDGGRLLRAGVWRATGDFRRATRIAAIGGRVIACGLVAIGIVVVVAGRDAFGVWYAFVGLFMWRLAALAANARLPAEPGALALDGEPHRS